MKLKIEGIDFEIKHLEVKSNQTNRTQICMVGVASNLDYMAIEKWFDKIFYNQQYGTKNNYITNLNYNTVKIHGIFPKDYNFTTKGIEVNFNVDYIEGDLNLFKIQQLRKEKLKKLNSI